MSARRSRRPPIHAPTSVLLVATKFLGQMSRQAIEQHAERRQRPPGAGQEHIAVNRRNRVQRIRQARVVNGGRLPH
jgi:hypothetical protein